MSPPILIAVLLILFSSGLTVWHIRAWESARAKDLEDRERAYLWAQFRRRLKASTLLALVGVAMLAAELIEHNTARLVIWLVMTVLLLWIVLVALLDMSATRRYFRDLRRDHLDQQRELQSQIRQIHRRQSNGHAAPDDQPVD